jgi:hypothetical protein
LAGQDLKNLPAAFIARRGWAHGEHLPPNSPTLAYLPNHFSCRLSTFACPTIGDNGIDGGFLLNGSAADLAPGCMKWRLEAGAESAFTAEKLLSLGRHSFSLSIINQLFINRRHLQSRETVNSAPSQNIRVIKYLLYSTMVFVVPLVIALVLHELIKGSGQEPPAYFGLIQTEGFTSSVSGDGLE